MTRRTFGFFRNPIQQVVKSSAPYIASMTFGAYCGLSLFNLQQRRKKTASPYIGAFQDVAITFDLLFNQATHDSHRYPYLDEQKRAEIFDNILERATESDSRPMVEMLLDRALESNQFIAINAVVRRADYLVSPELLQSITQKFPDVSYQMIALHAENKLAKPFEEAFFSAKSGVEVPRVFFDHPGLAEEVNDYINETRNAYESIARKIFFHDGNMTYNQTIMTASLRGDQLEFHPSNSCADDLFCGNLMRILAAHTQSCKMALS